MAEYLNEPDKVVGAKLLLKTWIPPPATKLAAYRKLPELLVASAKPVKEAPSEAGTTVATVVPEVRAAMVPSSVAKMKFAEVPLTTNPPPVVLSTVPVGPPGTDTTKGVIAPFPL